MAEKNSLADILKRLRQEKRKKDIEKDIWTQAAVAKRIGVSRKAYIDWEQGKSLPNIENLKSIIEVFRPNGEDEAALYRMVAYLPPRIHNLPSLPNAYFTGRETYLKQIGQHFDEGRKLIFLHGEHGIGKTQIALTYAYRHFQKKYRAVLWMYASNVRMLQNGYDTVANFLGLPEAGEQEAFRRVQAVNYWLETHRDWLLILENFDDLQVFSQFLPLAPLGHIIITTHQTVIADFDIIADIPVEAMEPEEGVLYLLRYTGVLPITEPLDKVTPETREAALQLVEKLQGHPQALHGAGGYIVAQDISFTDYVSLILSQNDNSESAPKPPIRIDNEFLHEVGLDSLSAIDKAVILQQVYDTLAIRIGSWLDKTMTQVQTAEFERVRITENAAAKVLWIQTNFPNYQDVVAEELAKIKAEYTQAVPQILKNYQPLTDEPPE